MASQPAPRRRRRSFARRALAAVCLALGIVGLAAPAGAQDAHVATFRVTGVIDQVNAAFVEEALAVAGERGAAAAVIEIDSPGGELSSMDRIIVAILNSPVPVVTWVAPEGARAGSAATFITLAGDVAAMAPSTNIGAASVVTSSGEDLPSTLEEKVTNDAVARIRALAEANERNADWAESAVREAASINAAQAVAMEPPVVDLIAGDLPALLAAVDEGRRADGREFGHDGEPIPPLSGLAVREIEMNFGQQFIHALSDPNIAFILFTVGFYGILAEFFYTNGFSGVLGAIALILAFIGSNSLPLNVGGLLLIAIGIGLFVLELTITSYGLLTIGGIVSFVLGAFALWTGVNPEIDRIDVGEVTVSPILIGGAVAISVVYFWVLIRSLMQMRQRHELANRPVAALVGTTGTAQTLIGPTGIAYAGGEAWTAHSRDAEIRPGTPVRVVGVEGLELIVEPVAGNAGPTEEEARDV